MGNTEFEDLVKNLIQKFYKEREDVTLDLEKDIYIAWICKTLQNNKAMASTTELDNRYFEITYNGDKNEVYFDSYVKEENICYLTNLPEFRLKPIKCLDVDPMEEFKGEPHE